VLERKAACAIIRSTRAATECSATTTFVHTHSRVTLEACKCTQLTRHAAARSVRVRNVEPCYTWVGLACSAEKFPVHSTNVLSACRKSLVAMIQARVQCDPRTSGERVVENARYTFVGNAQSATKGPVRTARVIATHAEPSVALVRTALCRRPVANCRGVRHGKTVRARVRFTTAVPECSDNIAHMLPHSRVSCVA
jgi:hypothetical protein